MKKDITRFIVAAIVFLLLLSATDIIIGEFGDRLAYNMPNFSGQIAKDNYRLHRMQPEIAIIGSSRGCHHYVTSQLGDSIDANLGTHISIYNASIPGKYANSNCIAAECIISRYRPKLVIFDLPENQLRAKDVRSDIGFSSPFYWKDTIVHRYIDAQGLRDRLLNKSSLYRYNNKLIRIASSYIQDVPTDDGYWPLYGTSIDSTVYSRKTDSTFYELNLYSETNLRNVFEKYRSAGIPLIMVCSPRFQPDDDNSRLAQLCDEYNIPFIEMYNLDYFNNHPELFKDRGHLNDNGAHTYTAMFFEALKPYLTNIDK